MIEKIDQQLASLEEGSTYGLFRFGTYFLSGNEENALLSAHAYKALMLGESGDTERRVVNLWKEGTDFQEIKSISPKGFILFFTVQIKAEITMLQPLSMVWNSLFTWVSPRNQ